MKRSILLAAAIGTTAVLGAAGVALADEPSGARTDSSAAPAGTPGTSPTSEPEPSPTSEDNSTDDNGTDDNGTDQPLPSGSAAPEPSSTPSGAAVQPSSTPSGGAAAPAGRTGSGPAATITAAEARRIALLATGGGRVTEVESEREHGVAVFSVEVIVGGTEHDLDIAKAGGVIVRHKVDRDDRRDDDRGRGSDDRHDDDRGRGSDD